LIGSNPRRNTSPRTIPWAVNVTTDLNHTDVLGASRVSGAVRIPDGALWPTTLGLAGVSFDAKFLCTRSAGSVSVEFLDTVLAKRREPIVWCGTCGTLMSRNRRWLRRRRGCQEALLRIGVGVENVTPGDPWIGVARSATGSRDQRLVLQANEHVPEPEKECWRKETERHYCAKEEERHTSGFSAGCMSVPIDLWTS